MHLDVAGILLCPVIYYVVKLLATITRETCETYSVMAGTS